jgi:CRISPR system Cascade subunit CasE
MLKLVPRLPKLATWAYARRLVERDGDLGYALHAALTAAFGEDAPKPFVLREPRPNARCRDDVPPVIYGYGVADERTLAERAELAEPDVHAALGLDTLAMKPMPATWTTGRLLDFEVRIRPVVRCDRDGDRRQVRERDAFLAGLSTHADGDRQDVYRDWLGRELGRAGTAQPVGTPRMTSFQRLRVPRRARPVADGVRPFCAPEGPDATFEGTLQVEDGSAFEALVRRGIGRHRAFGFGMLLLRPAARRPPC